MTAKMADAFVDSIGINTHFSYTDAIYHMDFPLVKQALLDLKIRHIRDGMHTVPGDIYDLMNQLGDAGIGCNYIVDPRLEKEVVLDYHNRVNNLKSLENPNEPDAKGGTDWVEPTQQHVGKVKQASDQTQYPAIGPSLINASWWDDATNSHKLIGDISDSIHRNNLHNYFGAYHPETKGWGGGCDEDGYCYGSIIWNIKQAQISGPGLPTWTTETGYTINPNRPESAVPEEIFATYLPRVFLAQWNAGIERTYWYQLADDPSTACCMGLMDDQGNRRKPFNALKNLISLLSDKGSEFTPQELAYTISDAPKTLQQTLLAKRDKTYWLCLWLGVSGYDPHMYDLIEVKPAPVTVAWEGKSNGCRVYKFDTDGGMTDQGRHDGNNIRLDIDDKLLVLKIAMC